MKSFKEEIKQLIMASYSPEELKERDMNISLRLLGWDGKGGCSLQQVGNEYSITRERVRQISNSFTKRLIDNSSEHLKTLTGMIATINKMAPASATRIEAALHNEGLCGDRVEGVLRAALLFSRAGRHLRVVEENGSRYVILPDMEGTSVRIINNAQKICGHVGLLNIECLMHLVPGIPREQGVEFIRDVLSTRKDAVWLDDDKTWIWLRNAPRNRLLTCLQKLLTVFSSITINGLQAGANRYFKKGKNDSNLLKAPENVLAAFINSSGIATCSDIGIVRKLPTFKARNKLLEMEVEIVRVINSRPDKIIREKELENALVPVIDGATHPKKYNFSIALNYSPLILRSGKRGEYIANGTV